jgi:hypothetical protein
MGHSSYPDDFRMIKSRAIRFGGHAAHTGKIRRSYKISVENPKSIDHV